MTLRVGFGATVWARGKINHELDGIGYYTQALAENLDASHIDCHPVVFGNVDPALTAQPTFRRPLLTTQTYRWSVLRSALTGLSFPVAKQLQHHVDVFHATDHHIPKLKGVPVVATVMDAIPLSHPEWGNPTLRQLKNALWRKSVQWADHVLTISEFSKSQITEHFGVPAEKISVIYLGVDPKYSEKIEDPVIQQCLHKFNLQRPFFLCVGTLQPRKNIERVLAAFQQLPAHLQSEFDLVIVGRNGWGVDALVHTLQNQAPDSHIKWLGAVAEADKLALLQAATSLIFPSLSEGFGLPLVEAFAAGIPVIASHTTALAEIAGGSALSIDPTRTESIAQAMQSMAESTSMQQQLVALGEQRARQFTWPQCAAQTADIYRQVAR